MSVIIGAGKALNHFDRCFKNCHHTIEKEHHNFLLMLQQIKWKFSFYGPCSLKWTKELTSHMESSTTLLAYRIEKMFSNVVADDLKHVCTMQFVLSQGNFLAISQGNFLATRTSVTVLDANPHFCLMIVRYRLQTIQHFYRSHIQRVKYLICLLGFLELDLIYCSIFVWYKWCTLLMMIASIITWQSPKISNKQYPNHRKHIKFYGWSNIDFNYSGVAWKSAEKFLHTINHFNEVDLTSPNLSEEVWIAQVFGKVIHMRCK